MLKQPNIRLSEDGKTARLESFYEVRAWPVFATVWARFRFDGASIPPPIRPIIGGPWDPRRLPAALIHDWLYASHAAPRWLADLVFLHLLVSNGFPFWRSCVDYWAVVRFGRKAWSSHGQAENMTARAYGTIEFFKSSFHTTQKRNEKTNE